VRRFAILPTFMTLGNLFFGFLAIVYVLRAHAVHADPEGFGMRIVWAGWFIFIAMIFDAVDGMVARLARQTTEFGAQLDSLCDMVSFGVAPALIIKMLADQQDHLERLGWVSSVFFVVCVALRLARFNVETDDSEKSHQDFSGLPSPAAAAFVAALTILFIRLRGSHPQEFAGLPRALKPVINYLLYTMPMVGLVLGGLMISRIRYPHVANRLLRRHAPLPYLVRLILLIIVVIFTRPFSLPVLVGAYIVLGMLGWGKSHVIMYLLGRESGEQED